MLILIHSHESGEGKETPVMGGGGGFIVFPAPDSRVHSRVLSRPALLATRNGALARRLSF